MFLKRNLKTLLVYSNEEYGNQSSSTANLRGPELFLEKSEDPEALVRSPIESSLRFWTEDRRKSPKLSNQDLEAVASQEDPRTKGNP